MNGADRYTMALAFARRAHFTPVWVAGSIEIIVLPNVLCTSGYFFAPMVVLSCSSVICTVVVLNLFYRDDRRPIPSWVKYVVVKLLARLVGYQSWIDTAQITGKSGQDPDRFQFPGSDTVEPENIATTGIVGEGSQSPYSRVEDLGDSHRPTDRRNNYINASQQSREVTSSRAVDCPDQAHTLIWKDVALVIDRAALLLSTVATLISIVVTVSYFIYVFNVFNVRFGLAP